jgi:hypothetical protein
MFRVSYSFVQGHKKHAAFLTLLLTLYLLCNMLLTYPAWPSVRGSAPAPCCVQRTGGLQTGLQCPSHNRLGTRQSAKMGPRQTGGLQEE